MGRTRDPKRDEAFEVYKASGGTINLNVIAAQLEVGDGTLRGWKAKDNWEKLLSDSIESDTPTETSNQPKAATNKKTKKIEATTQTAAEESLDELFMDAVKIVVESQQASTALLQRRLRIGLTRATRIIMLLEERNYIGPYQGDRPREVLIKELSPVLEMVLKEKSKDKERNVLMNGTERNAPINGTERTKVMERSVESESTPALEEIDLTEVVEGDGLTHKNRIFLREYLRDFNATRAAMTAGYSKKTAYSIGWELLRKPEIKDRIERFNEMVLSEIGVNVQRFLMEHMKIAFANITDYMDFGLEDRPLFTEDGPVIDPETGKQMTYKSNFVHFRNSDEVDGTIINEVKQGKDGVSLKLHDKMKSLAVLEKYFDLLPEKHKRMIAEEKLKLDKEKFEFEKIKNTGDGDLDKEMINDWVGAVMDDGGNEEGDK